MNAEIERAFVKLEQQRKYILKRVGEMTDEKYHFASQDKWAASQVIAHLITSEKLSLMYMKKKPRVLTRPQILASPKPLKCWS